ncbi:MAG: ABC transporter permease [Saprospiraceae bacterium]|nr:ABC transporter permease [Saprospiraceae bacterium]
MIKNNLSIAFRKLRNHRDYALLNILGLGISIACSILIFMLLRHHFSFEQHHGKGDRIARICMDVKTESLMQFPGTPLPMAKTLKEECSLVEQTCMRSNSDGILVSVENPKGGKDKYMEASNFAWVEPAYFEILDYPVLLGDAAALKEPNTAAITEKMALKFFGAKDALGAVLKIDNQTDLRVVAILSNLPKATDYPQQILGSFATLATIPESAQSLNDWGSARGDDHCLALLHPGKSVMEMQAFMDEMTVRHPHPEMKSLFQYKAKAFMGMHFDSDYGFGTNKSYLMALGLIGLFLLITACVNFINMATAQALTRAREVGVRKALGSSQGQLFRQFMVETGLIVALSLIAGLGIAWLALPYLNKWIDETLAFDAAIMPVLVGFLLVTGVALTFLSGFYPGWIQARFQPTITLKGDATVSGAGGFSLRRVLVTTQFAISQILIICAAVVTAQMHYAQDVDWGFKPGAVLTLEIPEAEKMNSLKAGISQITGVNRVSLCYQPPASSSNNHTGVQYDNRPEPEPWIVSNKPADENYLETFGLKLAAGRNILPSDTAREFIVNETFVKKLNLGSPEEILNKRINIGPMQAPVVGVVKDYHTWGLAEPIGAIAIGCFKPQYSTCAIQLSSTNPAPVLAQIKQVWESNFPNYYYEHRFMDERLDQFLETETMTLRLVRTFAGIAIFIGCLGLYGLATFMVAKKRKEIGVRKTLGANVSGLLWLFGKEYVRMILIAFVISAPIAWWAMSGWLQDFAYRISLGAGIFFLSLLVTLAVAVLTVGTQSVRAALANPVKALRSE